MTPEQLKASILQYAIQGKLVEQRAEEGTGEELYWQIQTEKQRLIKEGKVKKDKPFDVIADDDIPFDIPDSWKWCYIGELFLHNTGKAQNSSGSTSGVIRKFITTSNVYWGEFDFSKVKEMPFTETELERCTVQKGDLLVCEGGDCGRSAVWNYDEEVCIQNHVHRLRPYYTIDIYYFYYLFYLYKNTGRLRGRGVAIQGLSNEAIHKVVVPLAPLTEQKRIVSKIEELMPLVERYEQAWSKLEDFNKRFPVDMQKSLLQMAIQGKLVEQRAEEGTGEELYQQIQAEKQRLIAEKKIKKEKPLAEISEDEIPFDIPESWKWVRLQNITTVLGDGIHGTPQYTINGGYYFINGNNLAEGRIEIKSDTKQVDVSEYGKHKKPLDTNTILISINGTIGNYAFYEGEPIILGKSACYFSLLSGVSKEYICMLIKSKVFFDYAKREATQTTIKNVSLKSMRMLPVPLPPLAEQKRIVEKLEELLPLFERLK